MDNQSNHFNFASFKRHHFTFAYIHLHLTAFAHTIKHIYKFLHVTHFLQTKLYQSQKRFLWTTILDSLRIFTLTSPPFAFIDLITPSTYMLNCHEDITHLCLTLPYISKLSLTSLITLMHVCVTLSKSLPTPAFSLPHRTRNTSHTAFLSLIFIHLKVHKRRINLFL